MRALIRFNDLRFFSVDAHDELMICWAMRSLRIHILPSSVIFCSRGSTYFTIGGAGGIDVTTLIKVAAAMTAPAAECRVDGALDLARFRNERARVLALVALICINPSNQAKKIAKKSLVPSLQK